MKHFTLKVNIIFPALLIMVSALNAQDNFILDNPGALFKKSERRPQLPVKTKYYFETSPSTGREYLRQQDLLDQKGKFKSSSVFSDDGNKAGDIRYTYDASGVLQKKELRKIGKNEVEITYFSPSGKALKTEKRTKGDTLLGYTSFTYDEKGWLTEEAVYNNNKLIKKLVIEDQYNDLGKPVLTYRIELDSNGNKLPGQYPLSVYEYDDNGMILQTTVYRDKEKRKMLNWVYYKYQLDNDYKVIRQSGYNEEQNEISRVELAYTDSSIQETSYRVCNCPAKTMDKLGARLFVYNSFGELIREMLFNAGGQPVQTTSNRYDDFGNRVDVLIEKTAEPGKLNRSKTIVEVYTDQAKVTK